MIIGTAGHVDHGKTALVKALTGVDTDRLAEEKRRGITIELGYAYSGSFGFIDVPGHERLVHTMLAGAAGIDTALLVVALTEGVRPQTREHVQILSLLGIERGVVALTKADLAPERVGAVSASVRALLAGTPLAAAAMVPVSAITGEGISALRAVLVASAEAATGGARRTDGYARLAVDRAFTVAGAGLVVTGTLFAGQVAVEDRLVLSPAGLEARVRGLHANNRKADVATAGQRVALNIAGPKLSREAVSRGDWIVHPALHAPTAAFDGRIRLLADAPRSLRSETMVHLHLAAMHTMARVSLLEGDRLEPGGTCLARFSLAQPVGALAGDLVVLRDTGATSTIGGGVVVDPFPPRRGRRTPGRLAQLEALDQRDAAAALRDVLGVTPGWIDAADFMRARNVLEPMRAGMAASVAAVAAGPLLVSEAVFAAMRCCVTEALARQHRSAPESPGLQAERLRLGVPERVPAEAFAAFLDTLRLAGVVEADGPWFRLPGHRVRLSSGDEKIWAATRPALLAGGFRPPTARELAAAQALPEAAVRATLKRLARMGQLFEVAPDYFFPRETVAQMAAIAAEVAEAEGAVTAAGFRDRLDNGRKVAILVLEFFDKVGITVRSGDTRRVRRDRLGLFGVPPKPP